MDSLFEEKSVFVPNLKSILYIPFYDIPERDMFMLERQWGDFSKYSVKEDKSDTDYETLFEKNCKLRDLLSKVLNFDEVRVAKRREIVISEEGEKYLNKKNGTKDFNFTEVLQNKDKDSLQVFQIGNLLAHLDKDHITNFDKVFKVKPNIKNILFNDLLFWSNCTLQLLTRVLEYRQNLLEKP